MNEQNFLSDFVIERLFLKQAKKHITLSRFSLVDNACFKIEISKFQLNEMSNFELNSNFT